MVCFNFNGIKTKKTLIGLGLGQILSLLSTSISFTASEIARKGINAPTSQSFLGYVLLAVVYGGIMLYRRSTIKAKWYYYLLLALVDVEGNFLVVKAYQNTSMTSVMLLDCWAIPCVLVLTSVFLKTKYRLMKISGVVICIVGVVLVVFSDVHAGDRAGGSNPVKGDFLVIAGATLYAVSNVSQEFLVKSADRVELMSFVALFGAIIGAIQISIFERDALKAIHWSTGAVLPFLGIAVGVFLFYSLLTVILKTNGSAMFTLSLLRSDMWAVLIRIFAYHEKVDWLYYLAFATTAIGLIIYSMKEKDQEEQRGGEVVDEQRKKLIIAAIQISIFERGALKAIHWSTEAILLYLGIALALFLFYSLITVLIKINGATMFNLSLLTSDMWAVLIRTFGYHEKVDWLYFLAFATTAIGLIIYSIKEKDLEEHRSGVAVDKEAERKKLFDDDGDLGS